MSDFITEAQSLQGNNWLRNGNFLRIPRQVSARSYPDPSLTTPFMAISEVVPAPDLSLQIGTDPVTEYIAAWTLTGGENEVAVVDLDPPDRRSGIRLRSFDSGRLLRVTFSKNGRVTLEQSLDVINQFKGLPATLAFSLYRVYGSPRVTAEIDFGSTTKKSPSYYGEHVGSYRRLAFEVECPLDLTQIKITFVVEGKRNQSIGISGLAFALGPSSPFMPYCDSTGDTILPRGTIILWTGSACPPGFREVEEAKDGFLFQTYGDPNLVSGGTEEYQAVDPGSPYYNAYSGRKPEVRQTLGDNQHFVHQQTGLIGETIEAFLSGTPDGTRRLLTADFNDEGEPPGPPDKTEAPWWSVRQKSLVYMSAVVVWPFDAFSSTEIERFKRNTKQNLVLPGGVGDPNVSNPYGPMGADVWRDPHRHTFKVNLDEETLPPYRTFLFCEKI